MASATFMPPKLKFMLLMKHRAKIVRILLILFIAAYAAFFISQLFLRYYTFGSRSLDLGNMDQAIWNTAHGRLLHQTNQPGVTNRLSLHVEPILLPISLLYWLYSGPEILFIVQTVVVALGALPVFALARLKLKNEGLALIFALAYLMFPALQAANILDFHAVTMAPTFLLAAFYFLETDRPGWFAVFAVLAAACKEEIALIVLMMGLYALLIKRRWVWGIVTIGLSAIWTLLAVFIIPPMVADTQNIHWGRYNHLGDSPLDIVLNFVRQPGLALNHLHKVNALNYLRLLLTPTAFTTLFSPHLLLLALPSLGINLFSNFPPMQKVNTLIYAAPIIPAVFISSIFGAAVLLTLLKKWHVPPAVSYLLVGISILTATLLYHAQYGFLPGGGQFRGWPEITPHHRNAQRIFEQIPPDAALAAHDRLNPHVSRRETLHIFDGSTAGIDHIVLDVTEDSWPLHPVELRHRVDEYLDGDFGVVDALDGYLLLARNPDLSIVLPDEFYDFARVNDPQTFKPQHPVSVIFDEKLKLLGYDLSLGAHQDALPVVTLYWQALEPLRQDYTLWPLFIDHNGQRLEDPSERPLVVTLWYPTSQWSTDEIIQTATLPWDLGDEFTLGVGLAAGNWNDPANRLPITEANETIYTLENNTWARLDTFQKTGRTTYQAVSLSPAKPQQPLSAQFWNLITLRGVEVPTQPLSAGERLPFALYWQAEAPLTVDLTTFAHLLDAQGSVVAQLDWTPQDEIGYLPTTAWQPHRPVIDRQTMALSPSLPPGEYRLIVGWYYPVTGDRLPLSAGGSGDTLEIGTIILQ